MSLLNQSHGNVFNYSNKDLEMFSSNSLLFHYFPGLAQQGNILVGEWSGVEVSTGF